MKKYVAPSMTTIKISTVDIIQTSGLIVGGEGNNDNPMEWSLRANNTLNQDKLNNLYNN